MFKVVLIKLLNLNVNVPTTPKSRRQQATNLVITEEEVREICGEEARFGRGSPARVGKTKNQVRDRVLVLQFDLGNILK